MFDWDDANVNHIQDHGIGPEEAEDALLDPRALGLGAYNVNGERRQAAIGSTESGRILVVVYTQRSERPRVITARDARVGEKRRYHRRGK